MTLDIPENAQITQGRDLSADDGRNSIAFWQQIASATAPHVFYLHGFRADMKGAKVQFVDAVCTKNGFSLTKMEYRGHGSSDGVYTDFTVSDWLADVIQILDTRISGPVIVVGASMGAWLALLLAKQRPARVQALVGVASAPSFPTALVLPALSPAQRSLLKTDGHIALTDAKGQEIATFTQRLIDDAAQHDVFAAPCAVDAPVRLVHGMKDASVPWQHGLKLAEHLQSPDLKLTLIKEGDHLLHQPSGIMALEQALIEVASLAMNPL